jgi:pimeloyl-ACP methyl ester carboxylesterase
MTAALPEAPTRLITSPDGTSIAAFSIGIGRTLLLIHGTASDHRTWRIVAPSLAARWRMQAIDRRGRGDSGDAPAAYAIERELEDIAAVADALATEDGQPVDVIGHSIGGRIALGAALLTSSIGRVVAYESAPTAGSMQDEERDERVLGELRADLAAGDRDALLARFMTDVVGMPPADLAAFQADPIWARRAATAPTIVRELDAALHAPAIGLEALAAVRVPVLQLVGTGSPAGFRRGAAVLDERLARGQLERIDGARHAAHHSHPDQLIAVVEAFLGS